MTNAYINASAVSRISHELGALVLESRDKNPRYLPLQMLTRIISRGPIDWSSDALASCMASEVPIALISAHGENIGYISPAAASGLQLYNTLAKRLKHLPPSSDFSAWAASRERHALLRHLSNKYWRLDDLRSATCWQTLQAALQNRFSHLDVEALDNNISGLLQAWIVMETTPAGLDRQSLLHPFENSELCLLQSLVLSLRWVLRNRYQSWLHAAKGNLQLEYAFDKMEAKLKRALQQEFESLWRWVNECEASYGH